MLPSVTVSRRLSPRAASGTVVGVDAHPVIVESHRSRGLPGLAHIGLVPDMVADLSRIGMDAHYVNALFCSAEAYIRVWERAEALGAGRPAPDANRPWLCTVTDSTPPASSHARPPLSSRAANGAAASTPSHPIPM